MAARTTSRRRGEVGEPLPLQLPATPQLPGRIKPAVSIPCSSSFDSPAWRFSVDWDGSRTILFADEDGRIRLQSETLRDISKRFPEVAASGGAFGGRSVVVDGAIAVLDSDGRPDLELLGRRLVLGANAVDELPVVFLCTDLLYSRKKSLMEQPLDDRLDELEEILLPDSHIQNPDDVFGDGLALANAAQMQGLSGLLARRRDGHYHSGVAASERLHISLIDQTTCVVTAVEKSRHRADDRRLVLAEYVEGHLVEVGSLVVPLDLTTLDWSASRDVLCATVAHNGCDVSGRLQKPRLLTLRDDVDPLWCQFRDPVDPPVDASAGQFGFRPTIISALPLSD